MEVLVELIKGAVGSGLALVAVIWLIDRRDRRRIEEAKDGKVERRKTCPAQECITRLERIEAAESDIEHIEEKSVEILSKMQDMVQKTWDWHHKEATPSEANKELNVILASLDFSIQENTRVSESQNGKLQRIIDLSASQIAQADNQIEAIDTLISRFEELARSEFVK